jgi:type II secretory pathway pseudopilin PulG
MPVIARLRARLRDEHGFTLVELVVTCAIGVTLLLATFMVFDSALRAQTRVTDRTEQVQRGRVAMEQIVQQLRSQVCLGPGYPAVEYGDASSVRFYADLAHSDFVPQRRELVFANGTLTERVYSGRANPGGTPPYTFGTTPTRTRVLLDRIQLRRQGGATVPFFTYYAFNGDDPIRPSAELPVPLSAADRARVVQMRVSFLVQPSRPADNEGEPFSTNVYVRTADPTDPDHSPLCI